ncbi:hypothetical protein Y032_0135g1897 [Ancylostoma ceylanicum]|uniref:Uncharacterized protein n=1 Tax=Ancylostoma ceylanicum TaxID=53326 RepID=A0A016T5P7_9BILA|nr:hypothetical protein Y032_0135g1897 [Ancylostoma ceylanicum]
MTTISQTILHCSSNATKTAAFSERVNTAKQREKVSFGVVMKVPFIIENRVVASTQWSDFPATSQELFQPSYNSQELSRSISGHVSSGMHRVPRQHMMSSRHALHQRPIVFVFSVVSPSAASSSNREVYLVYKKKHAEFPLPRLWPAFGSTTWARSDWHQIRPQLEESTGLSSDDDLSQDAPIRKNAPVSESTFATITTTSTTSTSSCGTRRTT